MQTFQQVFFIPAMLIGTINFYHFIPLSAILTLAWGHKVSTRQSLLASFLTHFSADEDEVWYCVEAFQVKQRDTNFDWDLLYQGK